jgi:hypothetical protein
MTTVTGGPYGGMSENVRDQAAGTLREFRLEPKGRTRTYQKPYPNFLITCPTPGCSVFRISANSRGKILRRPMIMWGNF